MAIVVKPDMNYGVWAENGNIEIPSSEKVGVGWVIEKPLNEQMNWLQNRQDKMLQYLNQRGIPEWDIRTEYPLNAIVSRSGTIYQALSNNIDSDPTLNTGIWRIAFVSYEDFVNYAEDVDNIKNTDGFVSHYVRKSAPVMTAIAKGVGYNDSTGVSGLSFNETTPKIVNSGKTVVEFSGGYNPKDVVTHEQLALAIQNYKVGDIYISTASGDPKDRLGYGTWERFGKGKTLVGFTDSVSNDVPEWSKIAGSEFGEYNHKLTVDEIPKHNHGSNIRIEAGTAALIDPSLYYNVPSGMMVDHLNETTSGSTYTQNTGGDQSHNNVQPSIVVYFWKRVA